MPASGYSAKLRRSNRIHRHTLHPCLNSLSPHLCPQSTAEVRHRLPKTHEGSNSAEWPRPVDQFGWTESSDGLRVKATLTATAKSTSQLESFAATCPKTPPGSTSLVCHKNGAKAGDPSTSMFLLRAPCSRWCLQSPPDHAEVQANRFCDLPFLRSPHALSLRRHICAS